MKPDDQGTGRVLASFMIKEQYLMEYWEVLSRFRDVNDNRMRGFKNSHIQKTKAYRKYLIALVSLAEKLRPKIEKNKAHAKKYGEVPASVNRFYKDASLSFEKAVECMKLISNYLEEAGFTNLDVHTVKPENAIDEW